MYTCQNATLLEITCRSSFLRLCYLLYLAKNQDDMVEYRHLQFCSLKLTLPILLTFFRSLFSTVSISAYSDDEYLRDVSSAYKRVFLMICLQYH